MQWPGDLWSDADWQAIGTVVALAGVIAGFVLTMRGQKQDREIAENTAARSEAAASLSDDNANRVIAALETIAAAGGLGHGAAPVPHVEWSLQHRAGDTYILENIGTAEARKVEVDAHESLMGPQRLLGGPDLKPGEALTFMAVRTMGTSDSTITVSWVEDDGDVQIWRYPLPPRPKR